MCVVARVFLARHLLFASSNYNTLCHTHTESSHDLIERETFSSGRSDLVLIPAGGEKKQRRIMSPEEYAKVLKEQATVRAMEEKRALQNVAMHRLDRIRQLEEDKQNFAEALAHERQRAKDAEETVRETIKKTICPVKHHQVLDALKEAERKNVEIKSEFDACKKEFDEYKEDAEKSIREMVDRAARELATEKEATRKLAADKAEAEEAYRGELSALKKLLEEGGVSAEEMQKGYARKISVANARIEKLEARGIQRAKKLRRMESTVADLRAQISALEAQKKKLQAEKSALQDELRFTKNANEAIRSRSLWGRILNE